MSVENSRLIMKGKPGRIMGPVDYLVLRFLGNKFSGKIVPELVDLEKRGIIRVMDLVFIYKDAAGNLSITEARDLKGDAGIAYASIVKNTRDWFYEGDIDEIAASLPDNSSAALLLFENVWAIRFKEALLDAEAELIDMGRIPPEIIAKAEKEIMTQGGT